MKGLAVDPSLVLRRILVHALHDVGCDEVLLAADGAEALAQARAEGNAPLDLLVVERDLPGMDGLALLAAVRGIEGNADAPALLVTVRNSRQDVLQAMQAGVNGYALKPFSPGDLKEKLEAILAERHREEAA